jgi:ABC-type multidrug transport system fused ATPase/permease subunit
MDYSSNKFIISNLYSRKEKLLLLLSAVLQIFSSLLDLIGVILIGLIGSIATLGISAREPGGLTARILELMGISNLNLQSQVTVIAATAAFALIGKTFFSIFVMRRTLFFLGNRSAVILSRVIRKALSLNYQQFKKYSRSDLTHSFTNGINTISMGIVGQGLTLVSDISLLLILGAGLFVADPILASITLIFFSIIGLSLYVLLNVRSRALGEESTEIYRKTSRKIEDLVGAYRELSVKNLKGNIAAEIERGSFRNSKIIGEFSFMPFISKYTIEIGLVLGVLGMSAIQFSRENASSAVASISVFLVASFRIGPAILRIQTVTVGIKRALGQSKSTLSLLRDLHQVKAFPLEVISLDREHDGFIPNIQIENLSFSYEQTDVFREIHLSVKHGEHVAIVGKSGEGKTTLVDLICGNLVPNSGVVKVGEVSAEEASRRWPGAIAYVPQNVYISEGSIRSNLLLGYEDYDQDIHDDILWDSLKSAELSDFVSENGGLEMKLLEDGRNISGGQRQRLGLARCLVSNPKLIILDEATSALDPKTQQEIGLTLSKLKGRCTVLMIAHRKNSVRFCDRLIRVSSSSLQEVSKTEIDGIHFEAE